MASPDRRLSCWIGCFAAEADEAGEFEGEELLVDPDVAAVAVFGVVAEAEVEAGAAGVADGGIGVGEGVAADVTNALHGCQFSVISCQFKSIRAGGSRPARPSRASGRTGRGGFLGVMLCLSCFLD